MAFSVFGSNTSNTSGTQSRNSVFGGGLNTTGPTGIQGPTGSGLWLTDSINNIYYIAGKVGIGLSSPNSQLDVSGNVNISSNYFTVQDQQGNGNSMIGSTAIGYYNTSFGMNALPNITQSSSGNVSLGYNSGYNELGSYNTYIGYNCGSTGMTANNQSTAIGSNTLITASNQIVLGTSMETIVIPSSVINVRDTSNNFVISDFIDRTKLTSMTSSHDNYVIGYSAFKSNIEGAFNIAIGTSSLENNNGGSDNIAIGYNSLMSNTDGSYNVALGNNSLMSNQSGLYNVSVGYISLVSNTTGSGNMAIGAGSLYYNEDGYTNTAIGSASLFSNISGNNNTAIGYNSLFGNTGGNNNFALGTFSLYKNITGSSNIGIGNESLYSSIDANYNCAIGNESLRNNISGWNNIALGFQSLYKNVSGAASISIGSYSSYSGLGGNNISIGYNNLYNNTIGTNNVCIGLNSLYVYVNDGATNVATNVNNSTYVGSDINQNSFGLINDNFNVGIGYQCATDYTNEKIVQDASYNTFIGAYTGVTSSYSSSTLSQSTAIGYNAKVTANNQIVLGTNTETVTIPGSFELVYDSTIQNSLLVKDINSGKIKTNLGNPQTVSFSYNAGLEIATFNCNNLTIGCLYVDLSGNNLTNKNIISINVSNTIPGCSSQFFLNNNTGNDISFNSTPAEAQTIKSSFGGSVAIISGYTGLFTFNYDGTTVYVSSSSFN